MDPYGLEQRIDWDGGVDTQTGLEGAGLMVPFLGGGGGYSGPDDKEIEVGQQLDSSKPRTTNNDENERVPLYRSVGDAEKEQIENTGTFMPSPGGFEGKYFSFTEEGAKNYANQANQAGMNPPYTTVFETSIPRSEITPDMIPEHGVDGGIPTIVVPNEKLPVLSPPINKGNVCEGASN